MKIFSSVRVRGFRSVSDSGTLNLGPITLLVGRNNSGKSAILRAMYLVQNGSQFSPQDFRIGQSAAVVDIGVEDWQKIRLGGGGPVPDEYIGGKLFCEYKQQDVGLTHSYFARSRGEHEARVEAVPQQEPHNLIYPIFTGRRPANYMEQIRRDSATTILSNDSNLVSRIAELVFSDIQEADKFRRLCTQVLGINFNIVSGANGQLLGVKVDRFNEILLEYMGSGVSGILSLLVALSVARNQVVLLEEPENDLHPAALKALLSAILESSSDNQFVISTHSSVVLTKLGALPDTVVIHASNDGALPPTSRYEQLTSQQQRMDALRDLGYELADLDLGDGWLIFEESSAERIVRDYLIPWFAPGLRRLRTFAATGIERVSPIMQDFKEMFLFAHLETIYHERAWVFVDGDKRGLEIVDALRRSYESWNPDHFHAWKHEKFEMYYPLEFHERVGHVLNVHGKQELRVAKRELLKDVLVWLDQDESRGRTALEESAREVIDKLRLVEAEVATRGVSLPAVT